MAGSRLDLDAAGIANMPSYTPVLQNVSWNLAGEYSTLGVGPENDPGSTHVLMSYCDLDSTTQPLDAHLAVSPTGQYFSYETLRTAGAQSGQTLYISLSTVFNYNSYTNGAYSVQFFDPAHNEYRWASTGRKSNVIAVTMR